MASVKCMDAVDRAIAAATSHAMIVIRGPMFSGKSKTLLSITERARTVYRLRVVFVTYDTDDRSVDATTHDRQCYPDGVVYCKTLHDVDAAAAIDGDTVMVVDEIQFFLMHDGVPDTLRRLDAIRAAARVLVVAGLRYDYRRRPFAGTEALYASAGAEHVYTLSARCTVEQCTSHYEAHHSFRITGGDGGGAFAPHDEYTPMCEHCHFKASAAAAHNKAFNLS